MHKGFVVRYGILPSNDIINICGPESAGPAGWDAENVRKRKEAADRYVKRLNEKNGFYEKLERSILDYNIRNPILVSVGWCPQPRQKYLPEGLNVEDAVICDRLGGSRLFIAQKHGMDIPCIISDFVNKYPDLPILKTQADIMAKFTDKPKKIIINTTGVNVGTLPHTHLNG